MSIHILQLIPGADKRPDALAGWIEPAKDELGMQAVKDRMHVHDLHTTILHLTGLNHERLSYRYSGRDFRLTDVSGQVARETLA